ncbi:MAG: hypothetical protein ACOX4T_03175 [Acetivibrionales bacterium]
MEQPKPLLPMPIKAAPYRHQIEAFNFVCTKFGLVHGGEAVEKQSAADGGKVISRKRK